MNNLLWYVAPKSIWQINYRFGWILIALFRIRECDFFMFSSCCWCFVYFFLIMLALMGQNNVLCQFEWDMKKCIWVLHEIFADLEWRKIGYKGFRLLSLSEHRLPCVFRVYLRVFLVSRKRQNQHREKEKNRS